MSISHITNHTLILELDNRIFRWMLDGDFSKILDPLRLGETFCTLEPTPGIMCTDDKIILLAMTGERLVVANTEEIRDALLVAFTAHEITEGRY